MFGWLQKRKLRKEWRLVATLSARYTWTNKKKPTTDTVYYYLFENGVGDRKVEYKGTGILGEDLRYTTNRVWIEERALSHPYYLEKVRPWELGKVDPDIPSYKMTKAKEVKDAPKGQVLQFRRKDKT